MSEEPQSCAADKRFEALEKQLKEIIVLLNSFFKLVQEVKKNQ